MQTLKHLPHILAAILLLAPLRAGAQEVLEASTVRARASRRLMPALGIPKHANGEGDHMVRSAKGRWEGLSHAENDSSEVILRWVMLQVMPFESFPDAIPREIADVFRQWQGEKPRETVHIVYGPLEKGYFAAICKKTRGALGWKSIAFVLPGEGQEPGTGIYAYSHSVNWLENRIGYNLFPKLPSHIQEIIEEMTASELLCPVREPDGFEMDRPEYEREYDSEQDYLDRG